MADYTSGGLDQLEEERRLQLERLKSQEAAAAAQQAEAVQAAPPKPKSPEEALATSERQARPEGWISELGQDLMNAQNPIQQIDEIYDSINDTVQGLPLPEGVKSWVQAQSDAMPDKAGFDALINEKLTEMQASEDELVSYTGNFLETLQGLELGEDAGMMIPFTIAARFAGQEAPWNNRPEFLKDNPNAEAAFNIAKVVYPTLIGGAGAITAGAPAATTGTTAAVGESLLESATQDSAKDYLFGETIALNMGKIADQAGYDGAQLTKDLIEGNKPNAQVINFVIGTLMNLGINLSLNKIFDSVAKSNAEEVAEVLKKSPEEAEAGLKNINEPEYGPRQEPHDSMDVDSAVPVGKPTEGKTYINEDTLAAELIRTENGYLDDWLTAPDRNYFTNLRALTKDNQVADVINEVTATLKRLPTQSKDLVGGVNRVRGFIKSNLDFLRGKASPVDDLTNDLKGLDIAAREFGEEFTRPVNQEFDAVKQLANPDTESYLYELAAVTEEGFAAALVVTEELGIRLQKQARAIVNLDAAGIDFSTAVENWFALKDKANLFLIPMRRGKRRWGNEGKYQQIDELKRLVDADIVDVSKSRAPKGTTDFSERFNKMYLNKEDLEGVRPVELWDAYRQGSHEAGQTLKTFFNAIAYGNPATAVSEIEDLSAVLTAQLKKGNLAATKQLYYSYMLSRLAPQTASLSSNIVNLIISPIGNAFRGERAYGAGQFIGGLNSFTDSLQAARRAWSENRSIIGGQKVAAEATNLKLRDLQLDETWAGVRRELTANKASNAEWANARMWYWRQKIANNPVMSAAARALMAQDEWAKATYGAQIATGRAWKIAADKKISRYSDEFETLIKGEFNKVFKDGLVSGKIIDPEVLEGAKYTSLQKEIPADGNFIDSMFFGLQQSANTSAFWTWVSPFTKLSYNALEQNGIQLAGSLGPAGRGILQKIPRFQKIMNGEYGEVAEMQLKSNLAFAEKWAFVVAGMSYAGMVTGNNPPDGLPKRSFIIPWPGSTKGYISVPHEKLEPISAPTSLIADLVTGFRDEVILEGDYNQFMKDMLTSLSLSTLDKTFMLGMQDSARLFDFKNFTENSLGYTISGVSTAVAGMNIGAPGGLARMVTDWANPYKTIATQDEDLGGNVLALLSQRMLGGVGLPTLYNPLTGDPMTKTATVASGKNYWANVLGGAVNEVLVPGKTQNVEKTFVQKELAFLGINKNVQQYLKRYKGIPLSREQQSVLSKDINDVADLNGRLERYFTTPAYENLREAMRRVRPDSKIGNTSGQTRYTALKNDILKDVNRIWDEAKADAIENGRLKLDTSMQKKLLGQVDGLPEAAPVDNSVRDARVQAILSIPK